MKRIIIILGFVIASVLLIFLLTGNLAGCGQGATQTTTTTTTSTSASTTTASTVTVSTIPTTSTTSTTFGFGVHYTNEGDAGLDLFGYSVAGAGDVNNDGYDDVIVSALQFVASDTGPGYVRVLSGLAGASAASGTPEPTGTTLYLITGEVSNDRFGVCVDGIGDINNDGYDDFIVGASKANSNTGKIYVYSGATGTTLFTDTGINNGDRLGVRVAGVGDVNKDGTPDFAAGASGWNGGGVGDTGAAFVYSGANYAVLISVEGEALDDRFGSALNGAGDVNNDGYMDLIVGAREADPSGNTDAGKVYVYSGADGRLLCSKEGSAAQVQLGISVDGAGDVNNDGYADFIISSTTEARAYIYSGADYSLIQLQLGDDPADWFGYPVAGIGDVNSDGYDDYAAGALYADAGAVDNGKVYVYSGIDGSLLWSKAGDNGSDSLGTVNGAGDVNNDGKPDIVLGELGYLAGTFNGKSYVMTR